MRNKPRLTPLTSIGAVRNMFCQVTNALILVFFSWVVIVYIKSPQILIDFHHFFSPFTYWLYFPIPYVEWLVNASHTPELTRAYIELIYFCLILLFMNLFLAVSPAFRGIPGRNYLLSTRGFADFLEENIFSKLSPSVSLLGPSKYWSGGAMPGGQFIEVDSFRKTIIVYLKKYLIPYYGGLSFAAFFFFPWVAYIKVNSTNLSLVPFSFSVIIFAYSQVRLVFEMSVLILPFIVNKEEV